MIASASFLNAQNSLNIIVFSTLIKSHPIGAEIQKKNDLESVFEKVIRLLIILL